MGVITTRQTSNADFEEALITLEVSAGDLMGLIAYPTANTLSHSSCFIEIGILSGKPDYKTRSQVLTTGVCGSNSSVYWNGRFPLFQDSYVFALVQSVVALDIVLTATIEPLQNKSIKDVRL